MIPTNSDLYQHQQPISLPTIPTTNSQIDQEFTQINQQFQDLSLQYQNPSYEYGTLNATQGQATEAGNYIDSANQYAQQNLYDHQQQQQQQQPQQQPQTDFYGQSQRIDSISNNTAGYGDTTQQIYQQHQQSYNDPMSYDASNYGASEVSFSIQNAHKFKHLFS